MINVLNKICPELLRVVSLNLSKEPVNDCIIYTNNYKKLKKQIEQQNVPVFEYPFISALGVKLSPNQIVKYAKQNCVNFISKQTNVSAQMYTSKKILGVESFYNKEIYGENTTIAIIDTGIKPHLDFMFPEKRIIKFVDLINNKQNPYDDNGHGTFVASVACGNGFVSNKRNSGIAPKAKIISIKALDKSGETGAFKILEAMQWVYNHKDKYNIKVVCMSFGSVPLSKNDPLILGAEALWNIGVVVVAAAGNSGPESETIKSPGFSNKIITVGGLDDKRINQEFNFNNFEIASFSSRGPAGYFYKPDLVAPAVNIIGASCDKNFYTKMSGTSVATPMIAGICCLILSKYPYLTPDQLKVRLLNNCKRITGNKNLEGFGVANFDKFFN